MASWPSPLPVSQVRSHIAQWPDRLSIGAVNGPSATTVSGDADALRELQNTYLADGVTGEGRARDYASHSQQVEVIREDLLREIAFLQPVSSPVAFYSTVEGGLLPDSSLLGPEYWFRNLRQTVEFEQAVRVAFADGHTTFIECNGHPIMGVGLTQILDGLGGSVVSGTLRRDRGDLRQFLTSLASVHVSGGHVDWAAADWEGLLAGRPVRRVGLPTYAFQRTPALARRRRFRGRPGTARTPRRSRAGGRRRSDSERALLLVRGAVAAVLGHASPDSVPADATFKSLGLDSISAVEFGKRARVGDRPADDLDAHLRPSDTRPPSPPF